MVDGASDALRRTAAYDYTLPERCIAKVPAEPADAAKLFVVGAHPPSDLTFADLPAILRPGDVLVVNETRVVRARLRGRRDGGGAAEVLLLRPAAGGGFDANAREWQALVRPGRRLHAGATIRFGDEALARIVGAGTGGLRVVRFEGGLPLAEVMERYGELPLPPYVGPGDEARARRYQTIFARVPGSVAAPTASLHFTPRVVAALGQRGVTVVPLALDVGLGTFRPLDGTTIDEHAMHAERYVIPAATAEAVNDAKRAGRRIVAAGTTALRALEASAAARGRVVAEETETSLFITPGFSFRVVDALVTNFHLPRSTLLVLVAAFGGYERIMDAYRSAITRDFRFFSFGDAMFVERA